MHGTMLEKCLKPYIMMSDEDVFLYHYIDYPDRHK